MHAYIPNSHGNYNLLSKIKSSLQDQLLSSNVLFMHKLTCRNSLLLVAPYIICLFVAILRG